MSTTTQTRDGATIRFAVGECSLGVVLVAATARGVCSLLLGDERDELVRDLARRFPRVDLVEESRALDDLVAKVIALVEEPRGDVELPLDVGGTAFQQRVWQALSRVPAGSTVTYSELAEAVGAPQTAVRAVAQACGANPVAIAIPCHRVVRKGGGLSGYRWGLERKRALLLREARS